jgi:hypothetical protein
MTAEIVELNAVRAMQETINYILDEATACNRTVEEFLSAGVPMDDPRWLDLRIRLNGYRAFCHAYGYGSTLRAAVEAMNRAVSNTADDGARA